MAGTVQTLQGMRDWLPGRSRLRAWVIDQLRAVFERHAFEPIETPALEYGTTLKGKYGDEADRLIYAFVDRGGREVGLRYDLTVPLARVVATHPELPRPFRRYHIAPVWRAERPQRGRYREFTQCDVDIVGVASELADVEVISTVVDGLAQLGLERIVVRLNDRRILNGLVTTIGVDQARTAEFFRTIDKLDKVGEVGVRAELRERGFSPAAIDGLFARIGGGARPTGEMDELARRIGESEAGLEGLRSLRTVIDGLVRLGAGETRLAIDPSLVRGLDYYTGTIFEVVVPDLPIGSIVAGGRYDDLIGTFTGRRTPATGGAFGLDLIIDVIEDQRLAPPGMDRPVVEVVVTIFEPTLVAASLETLRALRSAGLRAELSLAGDRLANQLRDVSRRGIRWVVIVGPDEVRSGVVIVRDMVDGEQVTVPLREVAAIVRSTDS